MVVLWVVVRRIWLVGVFDNLVAIVDGVVVVKKSAGKSDGKSAGKRDGKGN